MKPFLLGLTLICSTSLVWAQKPTGKRAFTAVEMRRSAWTKIARNDGGPSMEAVKALQYLLRNQAFYKGTPNGLFDAQNSHTTENAVKKFQRAKGLKADGIVGSQTWAKLLVRLKRGDQGDAVRALQILINANDPGTKVKVDGVFGAATDIALRNMQEEASLVTDGVAGPQTWAWLLVPADSEGGAG